jgi:hypothetical protein
MKLAIIKFYLMIIVMLQSILLGISRLCIKLYSPLPTLALKARLLIEDIKNERTMDRKVSSKNCH